MLGSYGAHPKGEAYTKNFDPEESPSGMLARSGTYHVRSRVVDDDGKVYAGKSYGVLYIPCHLGIINMCSCHRLGMVLQARERMGVTCTIRLSPLALLIPQLWMYEISLAIYHDRYMKME